MRWVVGLGNPGREYERTRHNVGFDVVDLLSERLRVSFRSVDGGADVADGRSETPPFVLVKPMTYMNRSGDPMLRIVRDLVLDVEDCLVVVDDFQLDLGRLRLRRSGSDGGHNGLKSIISRFGAGYPRLRVGIGPLDPRMPVEEFVLRRFPPGEARDVEDAVWRAAEITESWLSGVDVETLMNRCNGQQT